MKIMHLDRDTRQNILEKLLKRSPNQYGEYESAVSEILERVKTEGDQALFRSEERRVGKECAA